MYLFIGKCVFWSPCCFWWDEECMFPTLGAARKEKGNRRSWKRQKRERKLYEGWPIKSCTFVFNFPQWSLKPNKSNCSGGQKLARNSFFTLFCRSLEIIFSLTGKEHVWSPLLLETRLASEVPPCRPFSPLSLSVRHRRPTLCGMAQGTQKEGNKPTLEGSDVGYSAKAGLGSSIQRVVLCSKIGFPLRSRSPRWSIRQVTRLH